MDDHHRLQKKLLKGLRNNMNYIRQIIAITCIACTPLQGAQKILYNAPVIGNITPLKIVAIASAVGAAIAYRKLVWYHKKMQFRGALIDDIRLRLALLVKSDPELLTER